MLQDKRYVPLVITAHKGSYVIVLRATGLPQVWYTRWNAEFYVILKAEGNPDQKTASSTSRQPSWNQQFSMYELSIPYCPRDVDRAPYWHQRFRAGAPDGSLGSVRETTAIECNAH